MALSHEPDPRLIWHNQDKRLHALGAGQFEWRDVTDPRASVLHRLREIGTFGTDPGENLLIHGDARDALESLSSLGEFAQRYVGQVKLVYIDPPYNTGNPNPNYRDRLEHSIWLAVFRDCLIYVKALLSEHGSVWVHLDDTEQHRARVVLDEVLGADNFVATVIWDRTNNSRATTNAFAIRHDYIHIYRKGPSFSLRPVPRNDGGARRPSTIWSGDDVGSGREGSAESRHLFGEPFTTPKPERLLERVIKLATDPGDIVLDCFAGSGTTAAVAHKLKRRWIAVEVEADTVRDFLQQRLVRVIAGTDDGGITRDAACVGGGGFTRLDVQTSP